MVNGLQFYTEWLREISLRLHLTRNSKETGRCPCDYLNEEQCEQKEEPVQRLRGRKANDIFCKSSKQASVVRESIIQGQRDNRGQEGDRRWGWLQSALQVFVKTVAVT